MRQSYQKGEVVDVDLGKPQKEVKGHEQAFYRPCVIITSFNNLELAVIVPCTTKKPRYSLYTNVKLSKGWRTFFNQLCLMSPNKNGFF